MNIHNKIAELERWLELNPTHPYRDMKSRELVALKARAQMRMQGERRIAELLNESDSALHNAMTYYKKQIE